jgi:gluconate 5-dehydrogenase
MDANQAFRLDGETALITGGGSGLGLAMASAMAKAGARVVVVGRREEPLRQACAQIGEAASWEVCDITRFDGVEAMLAGVTARCGPVSVLVNNAGVHLKKPAVETSVEAFAKVLDAHVLAAHNLTRLVLPGMMAARHGSVLFIASMASLVGLSQVVAYAAAKSAYLGMVRTLSMEVASHGVRVNAVAPGFIDSAMMRKALAGDDARAAKILSRTAMGCFGDADDIGWAAVYLASPAARFVTGVVLPVDGGFSQGF